MKEGGDRPAYIHSTFMAMTFVSRLSEILDRLNDLTSGPHIGPSHGRSFPKLDYRSNELKAGIS